MNFKYFTSYNVEAAEKSSSSRIQTISCKVIFLDYETTEFIIAKDSTGQYLINLTLDHQQILEKEFFGLLYDYYKNNNCIQRWLDPSDKIHKIPKKQSQYVFYFNFRYYVSDPLFLQEEYTRYHFYLQLRKDLFNRSLEVSQEVLASLGGLILQSEYDQYDPKEHLPGYTMHVKIVQDQTEDMEPIFQTQHIQFSNLSQAAAELEFINICRQSEFYGGRLFTCVDKFHNRIQILSNHKGIIIFKNKTKIILHKWDNIQKIDYSRCKFTLKLKNPISNPLNPTPNQLETIFKFTTNCPIEAESIWDECVNCHAFFRIKTLTNQLNGSLAGSNSLGGLTGSYGIHNVCMVLPTIEEKKPNFLIRIFSFRKRAEHLHKVKGLERTMSSVLELRRKSKMHERSIVRTYSKRSSSRKANPTSPQSQGPFSQSSKELSSSMRQNNTHNSLDLSIKSPDVRSSKINVPIPAQRFGVSPSRGKSLTRDSNFQLNKKNPENDEYNDAPVFNSNRSSERISRSSYRPNKEGLDMTSKNSNSIVSKELVQLQEASQLNSSLKRESVYDVYDVNQDEEASTTIRIKHDSRNRFGFNIRGGVDHNMPVIVSRIGPNMPADLCIPRLHEGDQILSINNVDITKMTHNEVVNIILNTSNGSELVLVVKARIYDPKDGIEETGGPDSGDAPPLPPRPTIGDNGLFVKPTLSHALSLNQDRRSQRSDDLISVSKKKRLQKTNTTTQESGIIDWNKIGSKKSTTQQLLLSMKNIEQGLLDGSLIGAFQMLDKKIPNMTFSCAKQAENMLKNRYRDILPYDETRVILKEITSDYINANYVKTEIPNTQMMNSFIAAQGPLANTCGDFWLMCWQQNVQIVTMVTTNIEKGRVKCHQYWPMVKKGFLFKFSKKSASQTIEIKVTTISEKHHENVIEREIMISYASRRSSSNQANPISSSMFSINNPEDALSHLEDHRKIIQVQYINWPDHGTPESPMELLKLVERIRQLKKLKKLYKNPVAVHCSAGIGRTGVIITMETAMDLIDYKLAVDPIEIIIKIRAQRAMLVQTDAQFQFLCEAILKYFENKYQDQ